MTVAIAELKRSCSHLLEHIEALGVSEVELDDDYYWFVEKTEVYNAQQTPTALSVGQLSEDLADIRSALNGSAPPVALLLVRLAGILRKVGESVNG